MAFFDRPTTDGMVSNQELKICPLCNSELGVNDFILEGIAPEELLEWNPVPQCTWCFARSYWAEKFAQDYIRTIKAILTGARRMAKTQCLPFELTLHSLLLRAYQQGGRCFYTGLEMEIPWKAVDERIVVDRVRPEKGFVRGNFVFTTQWVAGMRRAIYPRSIFAVCGEIAVVEERPWPEETFPE